MKDMLNDNVIDALNQLNIALIRRLESLQQQIDSVQRNLDEAITSKIDFPEEKMKEVAEEAIRESYHLDDKITENIEEYFRRNTFSITAN
jgi:tRNA U34 5-carboxymethylaminomethyl modifying GTPase MnmE/TrmE